jgi:predicted nucleic acid-binding protein
MIVLDASVVVELLINGPLAASLRSDLAGRDESFIVPHLLDIEVVSAVRRIAAGQRADTHRNEQLLRELRELPVARYPHAPLLTRIWELRHNFTVYDATYIALAEVTDSTLYTIDEKLCKGHRARVMLFAY